MTDTAVAMDRELMEWLPRTVRRVYEMGGQDDRLANAYRRINPQVDWHRHPVEDVTDAPVGADCLVYDGGIEGAKDPWAMLRQHAELLTDDGAVLARIRNVQAWPVIADLLRGRWRYRDDAMPGRGDIRFFTRATLFDLFEASGLVIDEIRDCPDPALPNLAPYVKAAEPLLAMLGVSPAQFAQLARIGSFLVRATKRPQRQLLIQGATVGKGGGGLVPLRMQAPLEAVATAPGVRLMLSPFEQGVRLQKQPQDRILILQRPQITLKQAEGLRNLHQAGYVTVLEIDDDLTQTPFELVHQQIIFRAVHAIQTSTPELAERLRRFNPDVMVFPNQLAEIDPLPPHRPGLCRLLFAATWRERDWQPIMAPLNRLLASRPDVSIQVMMDKNFFDALSTPNKHFYPYLEYADYVSVVANADVNLAPLLDTPFNRAKSDVKYLESASRGVVLVASPTVYGSTIRDGETGVLFADADEFERKLAPLLDDAAYRWRMAEAAYHDVRAQRMQAHQVPARLAWYRDLAMRKAELDRAADARWRNATAIF